MYNASPGLTGTLKLGGWHHFGTFDDQHFGIDNRSLADPLSVGVARTHNGDYGVYGVIDQMLWRLPGDDPKKGIGAFTRFALSPPDRNLISLYADAGINLMGLWDQRPDDKFGIAASFSSLSPDVRELDLEKALFTQTALPCAIMNWWWNSSIRRKLSPAGLFSQIFSTSSIPAPALSIPSIH